jgi:hypothetical protein
VQSEHSSAVENTSPPPELEHPANPEYMTDLEELFRLGPRNSGSGAVGTPTKDLQGTVDIINKAYISDSSLPLQTNPSHKYILTLISTVRARATSVSSVIGGGAVESVHDLPVNPPNRKK